MQCQMLSDQESGAQVDGIEPVKEGLDGFVSLWINASTVIAIFRTTAVRENLVLVGGTLALDRGDQLSEALTDGQHLDLMSLLQVSEQGSEFLFELGCGRLWHLCYQTDVFNVRSGDLLEGRHVRHVDWQQRRVEQLECVRQPNGEFLVKEDCRDY